MINVNDFKTGVTIELDNGIFQVIEFQHVKPGKGSAFVRTKLRNLRNGSVIDHTFNAGIKVKKAHVEKKKMQFLYADGEEYVFMDVATYDQLSLQKNQIDYERKFLKENMDVDITTFNSEILGVSLPDKVTLLIVDCEPGVKGDTATNATKVAVCETGLEVRVPLFINKDEEIIVSTSDGKYYSRK